MESLPMESLPMESLPLAGLLLVNLSAFAAFADDKRRARRGLWRIPERTLLLLAAAGGAPGALFAMGLFRHKTKKPAFRFGVPVLLVIQLALFVWLSR